MTEKQIIQETRLIRLQFWLARQPLDAKLHSKNEAAEAFKVRLAEWVDAAPGVIAPTFHLATSV